MTVIVTYININKNKKTNLMVVFIIELLKFICIDTIMSRALIVTTDGNPLKFNFWCKNYDKFNLKNEVDKVYVPVSTYLSHELKKEFLQLCNERNFKLILNENSALDAHGRLLNLALKEVVEDYVCFLEDDIWILKSNILDEKFKLLENNQAKIICSPRDSCVLFEERAKEINNFYNNYVNQYDSKRIHVSNYWLWPCWFFINTNFIKECQRQYIDDISQYNCMDGNYTINPLTNFPRLKKYNAIIQDWAFFTSTYQVGSKIKSIHPDYIFDHSHSDEILQIASFLLIRKAGYENCRFEEQKHMTNGVGKFDFESKKILNWELNWVHANASSGVKGMYGYIRNENNIPIYPHTFVESLSPNESGYSNNQDVSIFCYGMNLAFLRSHDRNTLSEFKSDYERYISYHTQKQNSVDDVNYISNVITNNVI